MVRYLIGIDFGHGETTASYIDLQETKPTTQHLNIRDGNSDEAKKVESCVCRDKKSGEWRFAGDFMDYASPDFNIGFKAPMNEITPENKEAFQAFICLVFEHILKNQTFLRYNRETGERNFSLYMACPSGWNKEDKTQIHQYLDFFKEIIPAEWVIKESDAAYYKFKDKEVFQSKSVLVIDIGSSTIDFTSYNEEGRNLTEGYKHGASRVERDILKHFEQANEAYREAVNELKDAIQKDENKNIRWKNALVHYIKNLKEDFYTKELAQLSLDLKNSRILPGLRKRLFDDVNIDKLFLEETILSSYISALRNDFKTIAAQVQPEIVVLTGGASRMPWLQMLVKDVFVQARVLKDNNPSYVVSDGIVAYAYANYLRDERLREALEEFWNEYTDRKLAELIFKEFNDSLRAIQLPLIKKICDRFDEGDIKDGAGMRSTQAIIPVMAAHNNSILGDNYNRIAADVDEGLNKRLSNVLEARIAEIFAECYGGHQVNVSIRSNVSIDLQGQAINNRWDEDKIDEITRNVYANEFLGFRLAEGNIAKDRETKEERQKFTAWFYKEQEEVSVVLTDNDLQNGVNVLKESIIASLQRVCDLAPFEIYQ